MKQFQLLIVALALIAGWGSAMAGANSNQVLLTQSDEHRVSGKVLSITDSQLTIQMRTGSLLQVDAAEALKNYRSVVLVVGENVDVLGTYDGTGVLHASVIRRAKSAALWDPDE